MAKLYNTSDVAEMLAYYEEEFSSGHTNPANYRECAAWLEGYMVGAKMSDDPSMQRCLTTLRGGAALTDFLKRHG